MFEDLAKKDGLLVPRFMLFDIVAHPGCDGWPLTAAKRGARLRDLRKALPRNCGVHWVGDLTSLRSFLSTQRLPHEVGKVVCLQDRLLERTRKQMTERVLIPKPYDLVLDKEADDRADIKPDARSPTP